MGYVLLERPILGYFTYGLHRRGSFYPWHQPFCDLSAHCCAIFAGGSRPRRTWMHDATTAQMDAALAHMDATLAHMDATLAHLDATLAYMDATLKIQNFRAATGRALKRSRSWSQLQFFQIFETPHGRALKLRSRTRSGHCTHLSRPCEDDEISSCSLTKPERRNSLFGP